MNMSNPQQEELQTLEERAKAYYATIKLDLESHQREDRVLIVALDPKEKRYWIGETESDAIQKKENEGNKNIVYFVHLPIKKNGLADNFLMASTW